MADKNRGSWNALLHPWKLVSQSESRVISKSKERTSRLYLTNNHNHLVLLERNNLLSGRLPRLNDINLQEVTSVNIALGSTRKGILHNPLDLVQRQHWRLGAVALVMPADLGVKERLDQVPGRAGTVPQPLFEVTNWVVAEDASLACLFSLASHKWHFHSNENEVMRHKVGGKNLTWSIRIESKTRTILIKAINGDQKEALASICAKEYALNW